MFSSVYVSPSKGLSTEGKIKRVSSTDGFGAVPVPRPMLAFPTAKELTTLMKPLISTSLTFSSLRESPLMLTSDGISVPILCIRLAWVLFGTVRSIGKTSDLSSVKRPSASTPQRMTEDIICPLISMWS